MQFAVPRPVVNGNIQIHITNAYWDMVDGDSGQSATAKTKRGRRRTCLFIFSGFHQYDSAISTQIQNLLSIYLLPDVRSAVSISSVPQFVRL